MLLRVNSGRRARSPPASAAPGLGPDRAAEDVARRRLAPRCWATPTGRTRRRALGELETWTWTGSSVRAALLHDVGLPTPVPQVDFTLASARVARDVAEQAGFHRGDRTLRTAITLTAARHDPGTRPGRVPALGRRGLDVAGCGPGDCPRRARGRSSRRTHGPGPSGVPAAFRDRGGPGAERPRPVLRRYGAFDLSHQRPPRSAADQPRPRPAPQESPLHSAHHRCPRLSGEDSDLLRPHRPHPPSAPAARPRAVTGRVERCPSTPCLLLADAAARPPAENPSPDTHCPAHFSSPGRCPRPIPARPASAGHITSAPPGRRLRDSAGSSPAADPALAAAPGRRHLSPTDDSGTNLHWRATLTPDTFPAPSLSPAPVRNGALEPPVAKIAARLASGAEARPPLLLRAKSARGRHDVADTHPPA